MNLGHLLNLNANKILIEMRILIVGGSGFIGTHLIDTLLADKNEVVIFDIVEPKRDVEFKGISILDPLLEKSVRHDDFDSIVNLAVIKKISNENYMEHLKVNAIGCARICRLSSDLQIPLVHISSTAVYGKFLKNPARENHPLKPITIYGFSKLLGEKIGTEIMKNFVFPFTIFRPVIVYGNGGDDVITSFIKNALNKKPMTLINGGRYKRDFLFVKDLVQAISLAIHKKSSGIFNIGTGNETTILKMAKIVQKFIPDAEIINVKSNRKEVNQGAVDISKIKEKFNFQPIYSYEEGILETIKAYVDDKV